MYLPVAKNSSDYLLLDFGDINFENTLPEQMTKSSSKEHEYNITFTKSRMDIHRVHHATSNIFENFDFKVKISVPAEFNKKRKLPELSIAIEAGELVAYLGGEQLLFLLRIYAWNFSAPVHPGDGM